MSLPAAGPVVFDNEDGLGDTVDNPSDGANVGRQLLDGGQQLVDGGGHGLGALVDVGVDVGGFGVAPALLGSVQQLLGAFGHCLGLV